jgi:hypothetical protein
MTDPKSTPTALEVLIMIQRQNAEIIKELRGINGKLLFFVVILILAIVLQFVASLFTF